MQVFKPGVTEDNHIPTLNRNLTSPDVVLDHAPAADDSPFSTIAMKTADRVFSHMNEPYIGYSDSLGLLVHEFHMQEMWYRAKNAYAVLKDNLPAQMASFCQCAKDVHNNGVITYLEQLAKQVYRNPNYLKEKAELYAYNQTCLNAVICELGGNEEQITAESWVVYRKGMIKVLNDQSDRNMALFMYCMLET